MSLRTIIETSSILLTVATVVGLMTLYGVAEQAELRLEAKNPLLHVKFLDSANWSDKPMTDREIRDAWQRDNAAASAP